MKILNAGCKLFLPLLIVALLISWNPNKSLAKPECSEWSSIVCQQLGVTEIACGKAGVNLTALGLITDQTPLKYFGFKFGEGPYRMSATRIDTGRYLVEIQSMSRPNDNYKKEITLKTRADSVYPVRLASAPTEKYTWNSAIQFDLEQQLGMRPVSQLEEKPRDFVDIRIVDPGKMAKAGFPGFKMNQGRLQLLYNGDNRWELSPIGGMLFYENATWATNATASTQNSSLPVAAKPSPPSNPPSSSTSAAPAAQPQTFDPNLLFKNSDFENGDLTNWTAVGTAFKFQPTRGDNPTARRRGQPSNHQGEFWIGTFEKYQGVSDSHPGQTQGDKPVGTITSIPFRIKGDRISFLIGGGKHLDSEYVALLIEGRKVLKATGKNNERMQRTVWNVSAYMGKQAQIVINDQLSRGWGHINADDFRYIR